MALMPIEGIAPGAVLSGVVAAVFAVASMGFALGQDGQVAPGENHTYAYRGPATISVATFEDSGERMEALREGESAGGEASPGRV